MKPNKTKYFDLRQVHSVVYQVGNSIDQILPGTTLRLLLILVLLCFDVFAQEWKVDPTWLQRYIPELSQRSASVGGCQIRPIFGEGDSESRQMISVARFEEISLDGHGSCESAALDREEEIYFVRQGKAELHAGDRTSPMRANDFTYIAPGIKHAIANATAQPLRVLVMGFKIPESIALSAPSSQLKIVNLDDVKEQTVEGHPTSVVYKLLAGPRSGKRDAIDQAYVITSFFWMNFSPGGTNFPHHHQSAEEIYLVLDGEGVMVAGGGMDGIEGRHPAKAGDAYYFRPNCTVGFYNQNKAGARAHILAVRSQIPISHEED